MFQFTDYAQGQGTRSDYLNWLKANNLEDNIQNQIRRVFETSIFSNSALTFYNHHTNSTIISGASDSVGRLGKVTSTEDALSTNDPAKASAFFQIGYERPSYYHTEREEWSKQANTYFNKSNVSADKSKWKFTSASNIMTGGSSANSTKKTNKCPKNNNRASWGNDGTGSYTQAGIWKYNELPDELKKYAIDPTSLGMTFGSSSGWVGTSYGNQCTDLSQSLFNLLWEKDGQHGVISRPAAGRDEAIYHARDWGGSTSTQPSKGAISGGNAGNIQWGHTYIVSHVFENGDILVVEQNYRVSGEAANEMYTWNYRIETVAEYQKNKTTFFNPETVGYKPVAKVKMLGN